MIFPLESLLQTTNVEPFHPMHVFGVSVGRLAEDHVEPFADTAPAPLAENAMNWLPFEITSIQSCPDGSAAAVQVTPSGEV